MSEYKNKILVALDGSEKAFRTIKYLCNFKPFRKKELVLHNIITKVPECYYDFKKKPFSSRVTSQVKAWELVYRAKMDGFMAESRMMLIAAGFKPEAINIMIAPKKRGIARDIMNEAQKGYDALLIRRRGGAQHFLPLVIGSVSTKLLGQTVCLPVMLAGIREVNHSLFLAVDGSEGAKKAVEFVGEMIENSDCKIVLCSVLRDFNFYTENKEKKSFACVESGFEQIETVLKDAKDILEKYGIQRKNIATKIIQGSKSRAGSIVEAAMEENCDTIVFGRKGKPEVSSFNISRVPWKVIHGAKEMTVWMVP